MFQTIAILLPYCSSPEYLPKRFAALIVLIFIVIEATENYILNGRTKRFRKFSTSLLIYQCQCVYGSIVLEKLIKGLICIRLYCVCVHLILQIYMYYTRIYLYYTRKAHTYLRSKHIIDDIVIEYHHTANFNFRYVFVYGCNGEAITQSHFNKCF